MADTPNSPAPSPGLAAEIAQCWKQLPNKALFFTLLAAWALLFQVFGNATYGYFHTDSLFVWLWDYYRHTGPNYSWGDDAYGIIAAIAVPILFWFKRDKLLALPSRAWWPAMLLLAFAILLHLAGFRVQQTRISVVGFFVGVYALMGLAWGPEWLCASFFPFFLFAFCVPVATVSDPVTFPMRMFVSKAVVAISHILGIDVLREGTALFNAQHSFTYEVAAACSGLHSSIAILGFCMVYGFVAFEKNWKRALIILSAVPFSILGNVIRMMCIIFAAEVGGQEAGNTVHNSFILGLIPYIPAFGGVFLLGRWLEEPPADPQLNLKTHPA